MSSNDVPSAVQNSDQHRLLGFLRGNLRFPQKIQYGVIAEIALAG
jgi:hypothetical protein